MSNRKLKDKNQIKHSQHKGTKILKNYIWSKNTNKNCWEKLSFTIYKPQVQGTSLSIRDVIRRELYF